MEVMLIVGLFASSALSLNFIVNQKYKLAGSMNIINLCLVVATAYQFDQGKEYCLVIWNCDRSCTCLFCSKISFKEEEKRKTTIY